MEDENIKYEDMDLEDHQIKHLIKSRKKEIRIIFKKYSCPEHKQLAKLRSVERINGEFEIDCATCCEKHKEMLIQKVNG